MASAYDNMEAQGGLLNRFSTKFERFRHLEEAAAVAVSIVTSS